MTVSLLPSTTITIPLVLSAISTAITPGSVARHRRCGGGGGTGSSSCCRGCWRGSWWWFYKKRISSATYYSCFILIGLPLQLIWQRTLRFLLHSKSVNSLEVNIMHFEMLLSLMGCKFGSKENRVPSSHLSFPLHVMFSHFCPTKAGRTSRPIHMTSCSGCLSLKKFIAARCSALCNTARMALSLWHLFSPSPHAHWTLV